MESKTQMEKGLSPFMAESANLMQIFMANTIGLSILSETLHSASFLFVHSNGDIPKKGYLRQEYNDARASMAFIQGTSLEIFLHSYELNYNAEELRRVFYNTFKARKFFE